jgi:hypothetical protein
MGHSKTPKNKENPESVNTSKPSWAFYRCDKEGRWAFTQDRLQIIFWNKILPRLKDLEQQRWCDFSGPKKESHFVATSTLNDCAQKRLEELGIVEDEIFSLRLENRMRIYGLRPKSTLIILWYDENHGDNDSCVCRSYKKHT